MPINPDDYPLASFKVIDGYDIQRSTKLIIALVLVEGTDFNPGSKQIRLYRWQKRGDNWRVDLCRMKVDYWKFDEISSKVQEWKEEHNL